MEGGRMTGKRDWGIVLAVVALFAIGGLSGVFFLQDRLDTCSAAQEVQAGLTYGTPSFHAPNCSGVFYPSHVEAGNQGLLLVHSSPLSTYALLTAAAGAVGLGAGLYLTRDLPPQAPFEMPQIEKREEETG